MCSKRSDLHTKEKEEENKPHVNWKPCERPEWLIFEIEQNLTIRKIQIKVAEQMMSPPQPNGTDANHWVMQLNMGEGKTTVIVPILAAILADSTQICQITVLKSQFATNSNSLRQYLGGLLNQRIYTFPCRRDMRIDKLTISQMSNIYQECKTEKGMKSDYFHLKLLALAFNAIILFSVSFHFLLGVILTLPEYRLSCQLKSYESTEKNDYEMATGFLNLHQMINKNVRNILDESDAILHPNHPNIYPVGDQQKPDGGSLRWTIAQAVFKNVPKHMKSLWNEYGNKMIEFNDTHSDRNDVFQPCRILDETMFEPMKLALIDDFLEGRLDIDFPEIVQATKEKLKSVLAQKVGVSMEFELEEFLQQDTVLILSGLLRFEVLKLVLTKRWRVNYGVDVNGRRKMAIPFRAKDFPAGTSEFGHCDVAICFTLLSYYYSGKYQLPQIDFNVDLLEFLISKF